MTAASTRVAAAMKVLRGPRHHTTTKDEPCSHDCFSCERGGGQGQVRVMVRVRFRVRVCVCVLTARRRWRLWVSRARSGPASKKTSNYSMESTRREVKEEEEVSNEEVEVKPPVKEEEDSYEAARSWRWWIGREYERRMMGLIRRVRTTLEARS